MSDFVCHLKIPFAVLSVVAIVLWTGRLAGPPRYYSPGEPDIYHRQINGRQDQRWADAPGHSLGDEPRAEIDRDP
jgi:hypothetical protein